MKGHLIVKYVGTLKSPFNVALRRSRFERITEENIKWMKLKSEINDLG
jgi:hypothetical protein